MKLINKNQDFHCIEKNNQQKTIIRQTSQQHCRIIYPGHLMNSYFGIFHNIHKWLE